MSRQTIHSMQQLRLFYFHAHLFFPLGCSFQRDHKCRVLSDSSSPCQPNAHSLLRFRNILLSPPFPSALDKPQGCSCDETEHTSRTILRRIKREGRRIKEKMVDEKRSGKKEREEERRTSFGRRRAYSFFARFGHRHSSQPVSQWAVVLQAVRSPGRQLDSFAHATSEHLTRLP